MTAPTEITVSQLSRLIGTPAAPVLIDLRIDEDFSQDPFLIPLATRQDFRQVASFAAELNGQRVVVYCKKISQGVMAMLRSHGVQAESLAGGFIAWRESAELLVPEAKIPINPSTSHSLWVTRHRPKIDRLACPWLIRRFIDRQAQFLFVSPDEVLAVAEKFEATAFDVDDVFWSHRGENCTFDTLLEEFQLHTKALQRLAPIVRGADTDRHDLAPEAAGLLAASLGLSRMYRNDLEQLEAGMLLYDAFYRWARDAFDENHDWPQPKNGN